MRINIIAKQILRHKMYQRVFGALKQHRIDRMESLKSIENAVESAHLRNSFNRLLCIPYTIAQPLKIFHLHKLKHSLAQWKFIDRLRQLEAKHKRNFVEDIFEAWKHKVAFKGGHSIHLRVLK